MNPAHRSISLEELLSFDLQQVQVHLDLLHSSTRAQESPGNFHNETRGIYTIVYTIDEFLNQ